MRTTTLAMMALAVAVGLLAMGEASGDLSGAKEKYASLCAGCHGVSGKGDGIALAPHLTPRPRDFSDAQYMSTLTDQHLFDVIAKGGPAVGLSGLMPPFGSVLNKQQTQGLVTFIRSLVASPSQRRDRSYRR